MTMKHFFDAKCLAELKEIHGDMTLKQLMIFMYIAEHPNCVVQDIVEGLDIPYSVVSKVIRVLSHQGYGGRKGIFIINIHSHPTDFRTRVLQINDLGRKLIRVMTS